MDNSFHHVRPSDLEEQHRQAKAAAVSASFQVVEVMLWELWGVLSSDSAIDSVSYDQEDDMDGLQSMSLSCVAREGCDVSDDSQERLESIEIRWNEDNTPALVAFLKTNRSRQFHRQDFHKEVLAACRAVGKSFDCPASTVEQWACSFVAHWRQEVLIEHLPPTQTKPPALRM